SGSGNRSPNATVTAPSSGCGPAVWQFGFSLAVGRVNGDAYADVLVGAPTKNTDDGVANLYLASSSGLTTGASADVTLASQSNHERFGMSVAIGDLAGDGTGDAIVGAPFYDIGSSTLAGRVYWFNNPVGDQTADATFSGSQNSERFGQALAVGKFTNDGRSQLAIGAYLWDKNANNNGDNDGRVVVAAVPEAAPLLAGVALAVPISVWRARQRRQRGASASGGMLK
ncbi:MAG TPA: hypothetical protein VGR51_08575, partial [Thermoplasmata archaeon]|nr:hypothetical protein [Thermoplasmata archaeon]